MKVKVVVKRSYGDIELEGTSFDEIVESIQSLPEWLSIIDKMILTSESPGALKEVLRGLVEYTADGPVVTIPREKLSDKEAILLLLYAIDPDGLEPKDIVRLLNQSGRVSAGLAARLSELRREGYVVKEGDHHRLTVTGRKQAEDIVAMLRG